MVHRETEDADEEDQTKLLIDAEAVEAAIPKGKNHGYMTNYLWLRLSENHTCTLTPNTKTIITKTVTVWKNLTSRNS